MKRMNTYSANKSGIFGSAGKSDVDSKYESVTDQSGIYAGKEGFDINVGENTDLKGGIISSEAEKDKNKISTGTLTYEDIKNKAEYEAGSIGVNVDTSKGAEKKDAGVTPNIGVGAKDDAESTTKATVSEGEIEIRDKENQKQDLAGLNRDTKNSLNKLGEIFDKTKVEERQELAGLFGEMAFNQIHDMKGSDKQKALYHALVGGIMSKLTSGDFLAGASAAAINKLIVEEIDRVAGGDPAVAQWLSAALGKVITGDDSGASISASGTKNNKYAKEDVEKWPLGVGEFISSLDFSEFKEGDEVFGYSLSGSGGMLLGGKLAFTITPDTVYTSLGATVSASLYPVSASVQKIYVISPGYDVLDFLKNGLPIPKKAYVNDLNEFNSVMEGVSSGFSGSLGLNGSYVKTPSGHTIIGYGTETNIGVGGEYSVTW